MNVRRRQYVTAADAAKLLGKSDRTVRRWIDEGKIKARHAAHNRYEIALDDLEALVEQQEGKEYVNPVEQLHTLHQQVETLTHEVETLKGQMAILLGERATPPKFDS
jgi:excisionase family DNA binding protein